MVFIMLDMGISLSKWSSCSGVLSVCCLWSSHINWGFLLHSWISAISPAGQSGKAPPVRTRGKHRRGPKWSPRMKICRLPWQCHALFWSKKSRNKQNQLQMWNQWLHSQSNGSQDQVCVRASWCLRLCYCRSNMAALHQNFPVGYRRDEQPCFWFV